MFLPSVTRLPQECVTCLFPLYVLTDRVTREPVWGALPPFCEALHALAHFQVNLHGFGNCLETTAVPPSVPWDYFWGSYTR